MNNVTNKYDYLDDIYSLFVEFLGDLLKVTNLSKVNIVGIGNSLSAGWTATDENDKPDVRPWVDKLKGPLGTRCQEAGIDLSIGSFALAGDNSNEKICDFILKNPSLKDVKTHFENTFDRWKVDFKDGPFENDVDKDVAIGYYSDSEKRFKDFFHDGELTITIFYGCTGEFLTRLAKGVTNVPGFLEVETAYLRAISDYVTSLSNSSYMTIGNFPYLTRDYFYANNLVDKFNKKIRKDTMNCEKTMYFNGMNMELLNIYKGRRKVDNHPTVDLQYNTLGEYLLFLIETLPIVMKIDDPEFLYYFENYYKKEIAAYRVKLMNYRLLLEDEYKNKVNAAKEVKRSRRMR